MVELRSVLVEQKTLRDRDYPACQYVFFEDGKRISNFRGNWSPRALRQVCGPEIRKPESRLASFMISAEQESGI